ncbi:MAG: hypothetical protein KF745_13800 [Phycisphaeraceae bacterium]|nr:hypothetical protein [Phycisphaeraceae bacterium]
MSDGKPAADVGGLGVVVEPVTCVGCGYDLIGLPGDGRCPECGAAVGESMRGLLLRYSTREYLAAVQLGHTLMLSGILAFVVARVVGVAFLPWATAEVWWTFSAIEVGAMLVIAVGCFRLTIPDPRIMGMKQPSEARWAVRVVVVAQALLAIGWMASGPSGGLHGAMFFLLAEWVLWAVHFAAMMPYAKWLGGRVPDADLVERASSYRWILPAWMLWVVVIAVIAPLVALTVYWSLLYRMRRELKDIREKWVLTPAPLEMVAA